MNLEQFYKTLKKSQEKKGAYFNKDEDLVFELLESLLLNKKRYGYMACPCRLASGDSEYDKDIICPCAYREPDMKEFGTCYCGLYVSEKVNCLEMIPEYVPERRPPEKIV
ncbi:MAG: ferredoxin:thioredoxin reductase [Desulfobacter postgatei]|uniref:ferredoxin:thioredoxin reductase n=1 Tax=Desulfobacter postgatei TaxID=2293 RepID=A0A2G6MRP9_9BACT|nr:MAG: ferredoxin:thioredoxin reductase [Desulfobacter postgatei]